MFETMKIKNQYRIILCIWGTISVFSCTSPTNKHSQNYEKGHLSEYNSIEYKIDPECMTDRMNNNQYSVDSVCTIHLPKDVVGFSATKVVVDNERIYLMDSKNTRTIFVFNSSGKYLYKIGERGRAKNEYIGGPVDFFIDKTNDVHVFDKDGQKILVFHNDDFVKMIDTRSYRIHSFGITSNGRYLFCMNNASSDETDYPSLMMCDFDYTNKNELLPAKEKPYFCNPGNQTFFSNGYRTSHIPLLSDSVLVFRKDTLEKVVRFDFNGKFIMDEEPNFAIETNSNGASAIAKKMFNYQGVLSLCTYQETESLILLQYDYQRSIKDWLYNKRTKKVINNYCLFEGVVPFTYYFLRDNQLIAYVSEENADMLREVYKSNKDRKDELDKSSPQVRDLIEGKISAPAIFYITIKN